MALDATTQQYPTVESLKVDGESETSTTRGHTERCQGNPPQVQAHHKQAIAESGKVIILQSSGRHVLVHIVPILATTVIIAINIRGYFIGTQFVGVTDSTLQSIALSALQVTAKLLEIAVIASLGYIILDLVQYFLLFDEAGLPLALTGIRMSFSNLFFLASPTFWSGIQAFRSRKTRILFAFLLLSCGLIATFVGPAAALLLIPAVRKDWLAGSLLWQVPPDPEMTKRWKIWETQLNSSSVDDVDLCLNPSESDLAVSSALFQECLWSSANSLEFFITSVGFSSSGNLTVQESGYTADGSTRYISWSSYDETNASPTLWAWSSMSITNVIANELFSRWYDDAYGYSQSALGLFNRYVYRDRYGTQTKLQGMLAPSARAACLESFRDFRVLDSNSFPVLPLNGVAFLDTNATYTVPTDLVQNTSIPRTFWVPKPTTVRGVNLTTEHIQNLPSAFLIAQIPADNGTSGLVMACSVDARWVNATQSSVSFDEKYFDYLHAIVTFPETYSSIEEGTFDEDGRPSVSKLSPRIDLDNSWLELLTPTIQQTELGTDATQLSRGYNFISKMLDSYHFRSITGGPDNLYTEGLIKDFQLLLSLLVVDGIARTSSDDLLFLSDVISVPTVFATGGQPAKLQQDPSKLERSEFLWTMTISGYAYTVDSTAYVLATTVLFSYVVFALCHIGFIFYKSWYTEIWWAIPDIVALAHLSPPSILLKNNSGGNDLRSSNELFMKLRVSNDLEDNKETVHLLVNSHGPNSDRVKEDEGYRKLKKGKKYC